MYPDKPNSCQVSYKKLLLLESLKFKVQANRDDWKLTRAANQVALAYTINGQSGKIERNFLAGEMRSQLFYNAGELYNQTIA